jgi:O-antigen/teichoic acid export membrane protein
MVFPLCCLVKRRPGLFYAMDLLGACLGTIIVNLMLIPLLGVFGACYGLGAIVLANAIIGFCSCSKFQGC